jgi:hypothetical protein
MKSGEWLVLIFYMCILLFTGCSGNIYELEGRVIDESTNGPVPCRKIIVHELTGSTGNYTTTYFDTFLTDSTGRFRYPLIRGKDIFLYNFIVVGDSSYAFSNNRLGISDIQRNGKHLLFSISKLTDFTIALERKTKTSFLDTLYVSWESNGIDGRKLPYEIKNYGMNNYTNSPDVELRWIGGNIQSAIKTKVYADKETVIHWELFRDGQIKKITDTIVCTRDVNNFTYFKY